MEIRYDREAGAVYIRIGGGKVAESEEVDDGVIVDYDEKGNVIGIEILEFSKKKIDLNKLVMEPSSILPVSVGA